MQKSSNQVKFEHGRQKCAVNHETESYKYIYMYTKFKLPLFCLSDLKEPPPPPNQLVLLGSLAPTYESSPEVFPYTFGPLQKLDPLDPPSFRPTPTPLNVYVNLYEFVANIRFTSHLSKLLICPGRLSCSFDFV